MLKISNISKTFNPGTVNEKVALKNLSLDVNDGDFIFGMVTNSISVGGFKNLTGKDVKLDDGVFEVTLIRAPHDILELNELIQAILAGKPDSRYVYQFTSKRIEFHSESEVPWTLDGEFGGCQNDVVISNKMHALTLLV